MGNVNFAPEKEQEEFLEKHKALGYPTKTAMIKDALVRLRREKSKELRRALYVSDLKQISGLMTTGNVKNTNQFRRPIKCLLLSSKSSCSSRSRGERRAR